MTELIRFAIGTSSLGDFMAAVSDRGLVAFEFGDAPSSFEAGLRARLHTDRIERDDVGLAMILDKLSALVDRPDEDPGIALDPRGSETHKQIWTLLRQIPVASTTSYGALAEQAGISDVQEVTDAVASNAIAILVPCHRVIKKDGALSGYRWGPNRKRALLERERQKQEQG